MVGCRLPFGAKKEKSGAEKYPEFLTIDVFDTQANIQGLQRGWFAHIVREKFNMQLNIIAPNQEGNGEAAYETMRASGKLGDLILTGVENGRLSELVREGLILDISDYFDGCDNLKKYEKQIEITSGYAGAQGIFAVPSEISELSLTSAADFDEPTNAPSIRWDLYKSVGYPEIGSLEDLLDVLSAMQQKAGKSDSGKGVYALSLFGDWDGGAMQNASALAALYGYDTQGFVMLNPGTGDMESIADPDSLYFRILQFLFNANQMGLVDPESTIQNYETVAKKFQDGAVIYSFWPWMGTSLYNSEEHLAVGKGFASVVIDDASYLTWGNYPNGKQSFSIMIGSGTKDPQRMVDFVDFLYSPEGIECCGSPTGDFRGPKGLTWTETEEGPVLTDFGVEAFINMNTSLEVPEQFGGGIWKQGVSALNFKPVDRQMTDDDSVPYYYGMWDDYRVRSATSVSDDWSKHYGTDSTPINYFEDKDMITIIPGTDWVAEEYPDYIKTVESQCRQTLIEYSWKMVFADSYEEYETLKNELIGILDRLGFEEVIKLNMEQAEDRYEAFSAAREVYQ